MKKICLLIFYLLTNNYIYSQDQLEWAPIGARWTYSFPFNAGNALSYITIESISDTIIQNIGCKVLKQDCGIDPSLNHNFYTYRSQDSVWIFDGTIFRLLYDFSAIPMNEWEIYGPELYTSGLCDTITTVVVDSTGIEVINDNTFKYLVVNLPEFGWQFSLCSSSDNKISEKFGSYGYMFPQHICMIDPPYPCELRCYEDPEFGFYQIANYDSCTFEYGVGVQDIAVGGNIKIYPNPAVNVLSLESKNSENIGTIYIYTIEGRIIFIQDINNSIATINLCNFKKGCYLVKVVNDNSISAGKIIKVE